MRELMQELVLVLVVLLLAGVEFEVTPQGCLCFGLGLVVALGFQMRSARGLVGAPFGAFLGQELAPPVVGGIRFVVALGRGLWLLVRLGWFVRPWEYFSKRRVYMTRG